MIDKRWLTAAGLALCAGTAGASDFGVGAVAGTLGLGGQVTYTLNDHLGLRTMAPGFDTNLDFEAEDGSDLEYNGSVELIHAATLVDYHPFAGTFRITGGVMFNDDHIEGQARCMQLACDLDKAGILVQGDTLSASADYDPVSPTSG